MSRHPYRRGHDTAARVRWLRNRVGTLARRLRPLYWEVLALSDRDALNALLVEATQPADKAAALERALHEWHDRLEHYIADAIPMAERLRALPQTMPSPFGEPWPASDTVVLLAAEWTARAPKHVRSQASQLARFVGRHDGDAQIFEHGRSVRVDRFAAFDCPFALQATSERLSDDVLYELCTPVARQVPRCRLVPEGTWVRATALLRGRSDTVVGDHDFDTLFFVDSDSPRMRRYLSDEIRLELLKLATYAAPSLHIDQQIARLSWRYIFSPEPLGHAIKTLRLLRHARIEEPLLRDAGAHDD